MKSVLDNYWRPFGSHSQRDHPIRTRMDFDELNAAIFGIVCGWHEVLPAVAQKFGWSEEQIDRLTRLRARCVALCPLAGDD